MLILAIDPGNEESGYALIDGSTCRPLDIGKISNLALRCRIINQEFNGGIDHVSIEMVESYGMPVGATVFETCVWIGRYVEVVRDLFVDVDLIGRKKVKMHLCMSTAAKDSNIIQALIDRFASGVRNRGKGTIAAPGWFYGFKADIWQAYALAVMTADTANGARSLVRAQARAREAVS